MHRVHRQDAVRDTSSKFVYEDNLDFNDYVDFANEPIQIFHLEYKASEVLFNVDLEAYKDLLANYSGDDIDQANQSADSGETESPR